MISLENFPYESIRPEQENVINQLNANWDNYKYFIINASPGVGKSAIAKTICNHYDKSIILTSTRQLQEQYVRDFPDILSIKGRSNYQCLHDTRFNCDNAPCSNDPSLKTYHPFCPFDNKLALAQDASCTVTSYAFYLNSKSKWENRSLIVLDECHNFDNILISHFQFKLDPYQLDADTDFLDDIREDFKTFMMFTMDRKQSGYYNNEEWILAIRKELSKKLDRMLNELKEQRKQINNNLELNEQDLIDELLNKNKKFIEYDRLLRQINCVINDFYKESNWIIEPDGKGLVFIPINVSKLFTKQINQNKIVFMSASIVNIDGFLKELGLSKNKVCIINQESSFDPQRSPIYVVPSGKLDYKNIDENLPKVIETTEKILNSHKHVKGIIHSTNYKITNSLIENIDSERLIYKQNENITNMDLLKEHSNREDATVLVSPSLTEGTDLKDDLSRFQVIVKLPFISLSDKRVKRKIEEDKDWYICEMLKTLLQSCCRSTRSQSDWSKTYILDSSFIYYIQKYSHWLPQSFLKRIKFVKRKS